MTAPVAIDRFGLTQLGRQIRAGVLKTHRPESCIYTTAVTVATLRSLGHDAFALAVKAAVLNAPLAAIVQRRGNVDAYDPEVLAAGGYGVGVGYENADGTVPEGRWPGHLVAICDRRWLCDFSLDQASRPQHGIDLSEPIVVEVDEAFLRGRERAAVVGRDGVSVDYLPVPGDKSWRTSADWARGIEKQVAVEMKRR